MQAPWVEFGNTVVDPCNLSIPPGTTVRIEAENIVSAAGTIGTTRILLNSAKTTLLIANPDGPCIPLRTHSPAAESGLAGASTMPYAKRFLPRERDIPPPP